MISPLNPMKVPTVIYEYLSCPRRVTGFGHPLNGGLEGYYQGLVFWVP
jgi:hypothetical protein